MRFVMLLFAAVIIWLGQERSGLILLAFFICYTFFAFGDGLVSVPWTDLIGSSLDKRWRARMLGFSAAISGVIMLLVAPLIGIILGQNRPGFPTNYAFLFGIAGVLFAASILPGLFIHEMPGGKAVEKLPTLVEFLPQLGELLRDDVPFRAFIVARIFTNLLILANSAQIGSSVGPWLLYVGFLVSGLAAGANLFMCFLNWLVDYAQADKLPVYTGLSNTVMAIASFVTPFIAGPIAQNWGYRPLVVLSLLIAFCALYVILRYFPRVAAAATTVPTPI